MPEIVLQLFQDSCYFGGAALSCLLDQLVAAFGGPGLFGLLLGGVIFVSIWVAADGSLAAPTVALVLSGTVLASMLPGQYRSLSAGVVMIGLAAAVYQVAQRYVLRGVS